MCAGSSGSPASRRRVSALLSLGSGKPRHSASRALPAVWGSTLAARRSSVHTSLDRECQASFGEQGAPCLLSDDKFSQVLREPGRGKAHPRVREYRRPYSIILLVALFAGASGRPVVEASPRLLLQLYRRPILIHPFGNFFGRSGPAS